MKLRVKRILKYLIPVPVVILLLCTAYFVRPFVQNKANQGKGNEPAVSNTAGVTSVQCGSGGKLQEEGQPLSEPERGDAESDPEGAESEPEDAESEPELPQEETAAVLSTEPLALCDLYAEPGARVAFQCFYNGATDYQWEYYDVMARDWSQVEKVQSGVDELGRKISFVNADATDENNGLMLRCRISFPDREAITETACLYVLNKAIAGVSVEDVSVAEKYVYIHTIPVMVEYADGTTEKITGLAGMHFLERTEKSVEESVSPTGNPIETVMTVITETDYRHSDYGANEIALRYHPAGLTEAKKMDITAIITGTDQNPPIISWVDFSDYRTGTVPSEEVTVTVMAEDDITPYPLLQYAVLPKGQELTDEEWENRNCFKKIFDQNGTWVIYCRDQYGNIGMYEKDIIIGDPDAPEILLVTLEKEGWQTENTICVDAKDVLPLSYQYSCAETGEDSGFITRNTYDIRDNGTWTIRVKDAAGNITSEQLFVSGIDRQSPVINGISTQTQKEEQN